MGTGDRNCTALEIPSKNLLLNGKIKKGPNPKAMTKPTLLAAEPQLFVADIATSCEFYTTKLGFRVAFTYGEPPFYAQVTRDAAKLNLRQLDESPFRLELRGDLLSASIPMEDAQPLFLEFQAAGVAFHQPLKTEPWGAQTFVVADPDGNLILFAGQAQ